MLKLVRELRAEGLCVQVVDDGSGETYRDIFDQAQALGCRVARHAVNLGKGRALKTGINAAMNAFSPLDGIVTADADGQHTCRDILRIMARMRENPRALITGARAFDGNIPLKSRLGNSITRRVYHFATGIPLPGHADRAARHPGGIPAADAAAAGRTVRVRDDDVPAAARDAAARWRRLPLKPSISTATRARTFIR